MESIGCIAVGSPGLSLSLSLIVTDMMLAAFPVFLRAGKEQELQQHLHGKL